jgi:hypothetical protein
MTRTNRIFADAGVAALLILAGCSSARIRRRRRDTGHVGHDRDHDRHDRELGLDEHDRHPICRHQGVGQQRQPGRAGGHL